MTYRLASNWRNNELKVVIVGCGGTGSFAAESVCRLMTGSKMQLTLIDPDMVEHRNTLRQNFYAHETGLPKSEALARRLASQYGVPVTYSTKRINTGNGRSGKSSGRLWNADIILGCVDNGPARKALGEICASHYRPWLVDSGNEREFGQILIGNSIMPEEIRKGFTDEGECLRLPIPGLQMPEVLQSAPERRLDMDCSRAVELREQSPVINQMMATLMADTVLKIITGACTYMALYVDLENARLSAVPANPEESERVLQKAEQTGTNE